MSKRRHISPNMHRALQKVTNDSNNRTPKKRLMRGGQQIPVRKTGGCGCGRK